MSTNLTPLPSGGPLDDDGPVFPSRRTGVLDHGDASRLTESNRQALTVKPRKSSKSIMKAAEGERSGTKPHVKKAGSVKNLAKEAKKKKRGAFGEAYSPVKAPNKGVRVAESNRLRESISSNDIRDMLSKALREKYPPPKPSAGPTASCFPGDYSSPWVQDVFPEDHLVVWKMKDVLWGADYTIDKSAGKANLSNVRRVETKYVDLDGGSASDDGGQSSSSEEDPFSS